MQVHVLYFGVLKDILRRDRERIDLAGPASVGALLSEIRTQQPGNERLWNSVAVAVNHEYAQHDRMLHDGDEVAVLPPVSGGAAASGCRK